MLLFLILVQLKTEQHLNMRQLVYVDGQTWKPIDILKVKDVFLFVRIQE
jgi:hypothetical protein